MTEILIAIVAAVVGGLLYTLIGIIPGTDETATMVPITIILVLAGLPAGALFAWEIGIIVAAADVATGRIDFMPQEP